MTQTTPTKFKAYCIHTIVWQDICLEIGHMPSWCEGMDHVEIRSQNKQPLPITKTGYKLLFLSSSDMEAIGDPVAHIVAWLDHEAAQSDWQKRQQQAAQLSLL